MFKQIYALLISLLIVSCARQPIGVFQASTLPETPNYSQSSAWAALPELQDSADVSLAPGLTDQQENAEVDVFFLHPTSYTGQRGEQDWNAPIDNAKLNEKTDGGSIKYQASIFNGVGRIFAPRYRQIQLQVFEAFEDEDRKSYAEAAAQMAYQDVRTAFEYYLEHYNNSRPIIIAAHSQGTMHAKQLLRDFFENKPMQKQLVTAYLVGIPVPKDYFKQISTCITPEQTGCYCSWRTYEHGFAPKKYTSNNIDVTNPLTWTNEPTLVEKSEHKGAIIDDKNGIYSQIVDAQIDPKTGMLWVHKPKSPVKFRFFPGKNYHIADYNLFYMDVRENVELRTKNYLESARL